MAMGIFEQLAWLTTRVKRLCCAVEQIQQSGAGSYKVYTALLTQSGGDGISYIENFSTLGVQNIIKGVTYRIDVNSENVDFSSIGAPSNAAGTYFVATANAVNTDFSDLVWALEYNTGAPVVTVLENTLGFSPYWQYGAAGVYTSPFQSGDNSKRFIIVGNPTWDGGIGFIQSGFDGDTILISTHPDFTSGAADAGLLLNTPIEIRVYN